MIVNNIGIVISNENIIDTILLYDLNVYDINDYFIISDFMRDKLE